MFISIVSNNAVLSAFLPAASRFNQFYSLCVGTVLASLSCSILRSLTVLFLFRLVESMRNDVLFFIVSQSE